MARTKESQLIKLGEHIQYIRIKSGLSQSELANSINKDQQSIQRLEKGAINPSYYYLVEIATGLGVSVKDLIDIDHIDS